MGKIARTASIAILLSSFPQVILAAENTSIDTGTTAWMLTSTALVLFMVPGLAMFYGGLVRTKNVLGTMMHSFVAMAIIGVLWVVCGYALAFGKNILGGFVGWNKDYFFLNGIDDVITNGVPEYVLAMFQGKFAIITPALISGALAERVYFRGYCLFIILWFLFVYCPLCHWVWGSDGWLFNAGADGLIDLAGGTVIHVSAGFSALVV
ncbi:MAG: ammonium transporter, partial [Anaerolineales bacterium]